jgi:hypothetical protein
MFAATTTNQLEEKKPVTQEAKLTKELASQFEKMKQDLYAYFFLSVGTFRIRCHTHLMPCKSLAEFKTAVSKNIFPLDRELDDDTISPIAASVLKIFSDEPMEEKERIEILNMARNRKLLLGNFSLLNRDLSKLQEKEFEFLKTALIYLKKLEDKKLVDEKNVAQDKSEKTGAAHA